MQRHHLDRASVLAMGLALALPLAACGRSGTDTAANAPSSQVADEAQTATTVDAPPPTALPEAAPVPVALPEDAISAYEPEDDAYAEDDAIDYGPPDYDFDYDGVEPWVWQAADDSLMFVEPIVGGYRDYYYRPGAINPYLVRDNDYTYGFQEGRLVAVYDRSGRSLPASEVSARAPMAGRYLARASGLRGAWKSQPHRAVPAQVWARREPGLTAQRAAWGAGQARQPDWQAYHTAHVAQQQQHWAPLAAQRVQVAATVQAHADPRAAAAFRHQTDAFRRAQPQAFAANGPSPAIAAAAAQQVRLGQARQPLAVQRGQTDQADQARAAQAQAARAQAGQAQAQQARAAQAQQAQRAQAQQARAAQAQAGRAQAEQARAAQAQQAQRAQAQQARAAQAQAGRAQAEQARAAQAQQAQRAQAQQARAAQAQAGRAQAEQARAAQAQQAQRAQAEQARAAQAQAGRAQAEQARAAQAQQAQRAQAEQARAGQAAQAAQAHMAQAHAAQAAQAQAAAHAQAAQARAAAPHPAGPPPKRQEPHA